MLSLRNLLANSCFVAYCKKKKEEKLRNANDEIRKANDQITKITPEMLKLDDIMVKINDLNFQLEGKNSRKDQMVEERKRLEKQVDRCFLASGSCTDCLTIILYFINTVPITFDELKQHRTHFVQSIKSLQAS